jgi:hypothetical protein
MREKKMSSLHKKRSAFRSKEEANSYFLGGLVAGLLILGAGLLGVLLAELLKSLG